MANFLDKLKILGRPGEDDYTEVDLGQFEEIGGSPEKMSSPRRRSYRRSSRRYTRAT